MFSAWYQKNYPLLTGQGLWLRGGEINSASPDCFDGALLRCLFARLSTWYDVADSITVPLLCEIAGDVSGVFADGAYLPPSHDLALFDRDGVPYLLGTQTKRGAVEFDFLGISNSIVQELVNIPTVLKRSGIPLCKDERLNNVQVPLVILGGANAINTSMLWIEDAPVDGIFVGEDPFCIQQILVICRDGKKRGNSKIEILKTLESVEGFFIPGSRRPVTKGLSVSLEPIIPRAPFIPLHADVAGSATLLVSEGCQAFCSFCAESWTRKPYRELPLDKAIGSALALKGATGASRINLYSFNFNQYSQFYDLIWELCSITGTIGLKSMRFDTVASDSRLLPVLQILGKTSITCGLEGISDRLRCYLNKTLSADALQQSLRRLFATPLRELKIFIIATGLETDADLLEFDELVLWMKRANSATSRSCRVIFSLTPLVRFPWTPQEFEVAPLPETLYSIIGKIKHLVCSAGFEFRQAADGAEYWLSQVLVRAANPALFGVMLTAIEKSGFIYYRTVSSSFVNDFRKQLVQQGISEKEVLNSVPEHPPWRRINPRINESYLKKAHANIVDMQEVDPCAGPAHSKVSCTGCGACPDEVKSGKNSPELLQKRYTADQLKQRITTFAADVHSLTLGVCWNENIRQVFPAYRGLIVARALMLAADELTPHYKSFGATQWQTFSSGEWVHGDDRIVLAWSSAGKRILEKLLSKSAFVKKVNGHLARWGSLRTGDDLPDLAVSFEMRSPFVFDAQRFCVKHGLKFVLSKNAGVSYYNFNKDTLKKQNILSLQTVAVDNGGVRISLRPGKKFDLQAFLREAFVLPDERFWVQTMVAGIIKQGP